MSEKPKSLKVTITDPKTGAVLDEMVLTDDYAIICHGNRYVKSVQIMGKTHMLAVAVEKPRTPGGGA